MPRGVRAAEPALTKGQRTRLRLLEAAEAVFGEKGYYEASVVEITQRARVAPGTFYVYFPSKKAIFTELVRTRGHEMRRALHEATAGLSSRAEIEEAGFKTFLAWVRKHPAIYRIVRQAEYVDREVFQEWYRKLAAEYSRGLKAAARAGEIDVKDIEAAVYVLMGMGDFFGMRFVLWDGRIPRRAFQTLMDFVLRGLGVSATRGKPLKPGAPKHRRRRA